MSYAPRRALVALLCVAAVVFAASLFPAAGFGTTPRTGLEGGLGGGSGITTIGTGQQTPPGTPAEPTDPTTRDDGTTPTTTETPTPTTETPTTETTTEAGAAAGGDVGGVGPDVGGLLAGLLLVAGVVLATLIAGSGRELSVAGVSVRIPDVRGGLRSVPQLTMGFLIGVGSSVPRLLDDAATLAEAFGRGLEATASGVSRALAGSARVISRGLAGAAVELPRALGGSLFALPGALSRVGSGLGRRKSSGREGRGAASGDGTEAEEPADAGPPTVAEAWAEMVASVPVRRRRARTPGEYARRAIDAGFPPEAVRQLTAAFEEVRYGDLPPSEERTAAARAALASIARHLGRGEER